MDFKDLYEIAVKKLNPRDLTEDTKAGQVAAAILTDIGNVYTGVCIDAPCSLGFCAESAAIGAMVTAGESRIVKLVAVNKYKRAIPPCGRCREFIYQINNENDKCEILLEDDKVVTLNDLLPDRWN